MKEIYIYTVYEGDIYIYIRCTKGDTVYWEKFPIRGENVSKLPENKWAPFLYDNIYVFIL